MKKKLCETQGCSPEYLRAGWASWKRGTLINISSTTHERKAPQGNTLEFYFSGYSENSILSNKI